MAYTKSGGTVSGTDITINQPESTGTSFLSSFLGGIMGNQNQEKRQKQEKDKMDYYKTLRESGYSADEASSRVNKQFKGTFLQQILGRGPSGFQTPKDQTTDPFAQEQAKKKAELAKTQQEAELAKQKAGYYAAGGPKRTVIDKMTPNQLQSRLKYLQDLPNSDDQDVQDEIGYINQKVQTISGYQKKGGSVTQATPKYQVGQQIQGADGKTYKITGLTDPNDPDIEEVQ